jgi:hypothetical protein
VWPIRSWKTAPEIAVTTDAVGKLRAEIPAGITSLFISSWDELDLCEKCQAWAVDEAERRRIHGYRTSGDPLDKSRQFEAAKVYFIGSETGPVKIGHAIRPTARLKELQTAHFELLTILATCEGGYEQESAYHKIFAKSRLVGEWFTRTPALLAEIERLAA